MRLRVIPGTVEGPESMQSVALFDEDGNPLNLSAVVGGTGEKGDPGEPGPPGETGSNYRGPWTPTTQYYVGDFVTANNLGWVCSTDHVSGAVFSAANWAQIGSSGGRILAYAEQINGYGPNSGAAVDHPGLILPSVPFTGRDILIEADIPLMFGSLASSTPAAMILEAIVDPGTGVPGAYAGVAASYYFVPTAGKHGPQRPVVRRQHPNGTVCAYKVQGSIASGGGNWSTLNLGASPMKVWAREA